MQVTHGSQAANRRHLPAVGLSGQHKAGVNCAAIQKNGTGPTISFLAAVFDLGITKHPKGMQKGAV